MTRRNDFTSPSPSANAAQKRDGFRTREIADVRPEPQNQPGPVRLAPKLPQPFVILAGHREDLQAGELLEQFQRAFFQHGSANVHGNVA